MPLFASHAGFRRLSGCGLIPTSVARTFHRVCRLRVVESASVVTLPDGQLCLTSSSPKPAGPNLAERAGRGTRTSLEVSERRRADPNHSRRSQRRNLEGAATQRQEREYDLVEDLRQQLGQSGERQCLLRLAARHDNTRPKWISAPSTPRPKDRLADPRLTREHQRRRTRIDQVEKPAIEASFAARPITSTP
jgi:hypothetical protein